ncbi:MAG TPA: hypothetical protein VNB24_08185 [Acidimicrobiales bacterium]|nr:hypothetical protein [Acidimicrobiales bacterium]
MPRRAVRRRAKPGRRHWVDTPEYSGISHIKTLGHSPDPPLTRRDGRLLSLFLSALIVLPTLAVGAWWVLSR